MLRRGADATLQIIIQGRGGQGAQLAGNVLAMAFFAEGREVQSFATYGGARRGTPVSSFIRVDDKPIRARCDIERADAILCFDASLLEARLLAAAGPQTLIVVNSRAHAGAVRGGAAGLPRAAGRRHRHLAAKRARAHRQLGAPRRVRLRAGSARARHAAARGGRSGAEGGSRERCGVPRRLSLGRGAARAASRMNRPALPPSTWTTGTTEVIRTGTWRAAVPVYRQAPSPCRFACPSTGAFPSGWSRRKRGDFHGAWITLTDHNPFPAVVGRVCHRPCEAACNRGAYDEPLAVRSLERYIGDLALAERWASAGADRTGARRGDRRRSFRIVGRVPAAPPRLRGQHLRGAARARRPAARRHSALPAAARGARRRDPPHPRARHRRARRHRAREPGAVPQAARAIRRGISPSARGGRSASRSSTTSRPG